MNGSWLFVFVPSNLFYDLALALPFSNNLILGSVSVTHVSGCINLVSHIFNPRASTVDIQTSLATFVNTSEISRDFTKMSFPQFSLLPAELRQYIWKFALPAPSQVYTISFFHPKLYRDPNIPHSFWDVASCPRRAPPAVLQTCREARAMGAGYHLAYQRSSEVVDPLFAHRVTDFISEGARHELSYAFVPLPITTKRGKVLCCSNLDLVILSPWTWRIDRREGMSYHVTALDARDEGLDTHAMTFTDIRYVAMSLAVFYTWFDRPRNPGMLTFSSLHVLFIVKEMLPGAFIDTWRGTSVRWNEFSNWNLEALFERSLRSRGWEVQELKCVETVQDAMRDIENRNSMKGSSRSLPSLSNIMDLDGVIIGSNV